MNLDDFFGDQPVWEVCPRNADRPWVSASGDVRVDPPSYAASRADWRALKLPGRVMHTGSQAKHRIPGLAWWASVQVVMVLLRRLGLGPLYQSTAELPLEDGVNWIHEDTDFDVVSVSGTRIRVAALDGSFDARNWVVYNYQHENSLYIPGGEAVHYINRPIRGSVQPFDEVGPAPNSVLAGKSSPMVVGIEPVSGDWEGYEAGQDFVIVVDQDCTNITTMADPEGDAADYITVRMHVAAPAEWMTLTESRPFYAARRFRTITFAQYEAADGGAIDLKDDALADTRIARPFVGNDEFSPTFKVERIDAGVATDITAAFLAAGRVAVEHVGASGYRTRLWLGETVQDVDGFDALLTAGQVLRVLYCIPGTAGRDPAVCQSRCHHARQSGDGRTFCALSDNGYVDEAAEEWVSTPPSGIEKFRAECYQWSSGSGAAGCASFTPRVPTTVADWIGFWNQLWAERGLQLIQQGVGSTDFRIRRAGVEGLIHVGGGRLDIGMELGEASEYMARQSSAGYLNEALEWVTGLLMTHRDNGVDLDDPDTWGEPGLLEYRGISPNVTNDLGANWGSADDPNYAARRVPRMPAVQAEGTSSGGRSAGDRGRLVNWRDLAVSVQVTEDDEPQDCGGFEVISNGDGTMTINFKNGNPLGLFTAAVVAGTIAAASLDSGLLKLELANAFRTTYFTNTATMPPSVGTGTIRTGGQVVRPHQRHEILADPLFGDGGNIARGVLPGDVAAFIPPDSGGTVHGFEVVKAQPCAGDTEAYGWNGNPATTPPASIADYLPTAHNTWGIRRDVVWTRPRNITDFAADVGDLVGTTVAFGQDGIWGGANPPTVQIAAAGSGDWATVTPESINYYSGEIVLAEADVAAVGGPLDILVEGEVYDRRRYVAKADVQLVQDTIKAVDHFKVPVSAAGGFYGEITNQENLCQFEYGSFVDDVWTPGAVVGEIIGGAWGGGSASISMATTFVPGDDLLQPSIVFNCPAFPLDMSGMMSGVADDAEIEQASLVYKMDDLTETETVCIANATGYDTGITTSSDSASIACAVVADLPGVDAPVVLFVSAPFTTTAGEKASVDFTSFAQAWLTTWRRSEYRNFRGIFVPRNPLSPELPEVEDLAVLLAEKTYSVYQPSKLDCTTSGNNDAGSTGTANPDYLDRRYQLTLRDVEYSTPTVDGMYVKLATLPSPGPTALPANPATNGFRRIKHPWVAEE